MRARAKLCALVMAALAVTACGQLDHTAAAPSPSSAPAAAAPATCHSRGSGEMVLPDASAACTPGAVNPEVTPANAGQTICRQGWTRTVRPPVSYTSALKRQQERAYGIPAGEVTEEDHLIALELGGAARDPKNLWPEPSSGTRNQPTNPKDKVENAANAAVCSGRMPLATAQQQMAADWISLGHQLGVS